MYVRLKLGYKLFEDSPCKFEHNSMLPVPIDQEVITGLLPKLSPAAAHLYIYFLYLDHLKLEQFTPDLSTIKAVAFPSWSDELFDSALSELLLVRVNGDLLVRLDCSQMTLGDFFKEGAE